MATSLASVDDSAKLLEEKLQLLTLQVAEEFQDTEKQMRARAAALGIDTAAAAMTSSTTSGIGVDTAWILPKRNNTFNNIEIWRNRCNCEANFYLLIYRADESFSSIV